MGRCAECKTETDRTFVWKDVFSCSEACDAKLDEQLEMASAHLAPHEDENGIVLTPRLDDGERLQMLIAKEDHRKLRRGGQAHVDGVGRHFGRITDRMTGLSYEAYGAACEWSRKDGGCWCDVRVVPVKDDA